MQGSEDDSHGCAAVEEGVKAALDAQAGFVVEVELQGRIQIDDWERAWDRERIFVRGSAFQAGVPSSACPQR